MIRFKDISTRLYTAIVFTAFVLAGLMVNQWTYFALLLIISILCGYELTMIISGLKRKLRFFISLTFSFIPVLMGMLVREGFLNVDDRMLLGIIACWLLLLLASELLSVQSSPVEKTARSMFSLIYVGIPSLLAYELAYKDGSFSYLPLLGVIVLIWINDTGAYLVGSSIGKRPLMPTVSPKKTVEGTLGGIIATIVLAWPLSMINDAFTCPQWLVVAAITVVSGTIGDLVESKLKRHYGIKDTGTYLPGHGGFLDRFDSFLFVVSFVYLYTQLI